MSKNIIGPVLLLAHYEKLSIIPCHTLIQEVAKINQEIMLTSNRGKRLFIQSTKKIKLGNILGRV